MSTVDIENNKIVDGLPTTTTTTTKYLRRFRFLSDVDDHDDYDAAGGEEEEDAGDENDDVDDDYDRGCWTPRYVDSTAVIIVDALRFDFARDCLPLSVGSRLRGRGRGTSRLVRFVADPPTVTMQRLQGVDHGGLPTFADITGSFGGASVDEDSWVEQLRDAPWDRRSRFRRRGRSRWRRPRIAFVGDDTWVDIFPMQFNDCHPYPLFNTRDLDTVDDGCMSHLPRLLTGLAGTRPDSVEEEEEVRVNGGRDGNNSATSLLSSSSFELIVAHFLGVDHVGHTYGPNDPHMEWKLHQMDVVLSDIFGMIDDAPGDSCMVAFVLGNHGMTENGNHGGGTSDEVNA
ncbi:hypothetical protein ACHAW5_000600, partial [Stephanodiscus triporus]